MASFPGLSPDQLPGPLRAAVGLAVTAAENAKYLPEKALEFPMIVVSGALQLSLRAQQHYAAFAARGEEVLAGRAPEQEVAPWATFDPPVDDSPIAQPAQAPKKVSARRDSTPSRFDAVDDLDGGLDDLDDLDGPDGGVDGFDQPAGRDG